MVFQISILLNIYKGCLEKKLKYVMSFNIIMHINNLFCYNKGLLIDKKFNTFMINFINKNVYGILDQKK